MDQRSHRWVGPRFGSTCLAHSECAICVAGGAAGGLGSVSKVDRSVLACLIDVDVQGAASRRLLPPPPAAPLWPRRPRCCSPIPAGYSADQLTAGLQLAVALFVLLAALSSPQAWTALTLQSATITPVYAVVTLCVVLQPNLGGCWLQCSELAACLPHASPNARQATVTRDLAPTPARCPPPPHPRLARPLPTLQALLGSLCSFGQRERWWGAWLA